MVCTHHSVNPSLLPRHGRGGEGVNHSTLEHVVLGHTVRLAIRPTHRSSASSLALISARSDSASFPAGGGVRRCRALHRSRRVRNRGSGGAEVCASIHRWRWRCKGRAASQQRWGLGGRGGVVPAKAARSKGGGGSLRQRREAVGRRRRSLYFVRVREREREGGR